MVTESTKMFIASDGQEFLSRIDAVRYERLMEAKREHESSMRKYARALAETQKTADGQPFEVGEWEYYAIGRNAVSHEIRLVRPSLHEVSIGEFGDARLINRLVPHDSYRVSDLYAAKGNAIQKLVKLIREDAKDLTDNADRLEAGLQSNNEEQ